MARNPAIQLAALALASRIRRDMQTDMQTVARIAVKRGTGPGPHYHNSFSTWTEVRGAYVAVVAYNSVRHANIIERGSREHIILPRNARRLRFYSKRAGRVIYSRGVIHPGTRPQRVMAYGLALTMSRSYLKRRA